jgi:hypothetical protein
MARIDGDDRDLCVGRIVEGTLSPTCKEDDDHATGHPRWSPDGRTLLVRASRGDEFGIVRYRSRRAFSPRAGDWRGGRFATPLEPGRGVLEAAISPDGERLAAIANLDTRVPRLYVTEARDLRLRDADPVPNVRACKLAWRADSRELVIVDLGAGCTDGTGQLSRLDVGDPTRAVPLGAAGDNPSFQPRKLPG